MDVSDRQRSAQRSYKSKRHRDRNRPMSNPQYSSSDGESGHVTGSTGCRECDMNLSCSGDGGRMMHAGRYSPAVVAQCNGRDYPAGVLPPGLALPPDDHHFTPIEAYENNAVNPHYSYMSASDGEADMDTPPSHHPHRQSKWTAEKPRDRNRQRDVHDRTQKNSQIPPSGSSVSISSQTSSSSPSHCAMSDHDDELDIPVHSNRTMDRSTLGSSGTGENLYSRINENSTLPLPSIPPHPSERALGPAVPPRINMQMLAAAHTGAELPSRRSAAYQDLEEDFEPQFLRQTPSGTIYIPQGPGHCSPLSSPPVPFPRTVPRTSSLPRHAHSQQSQLARTPTANSTLSGYHRAATLPDHTVIPPPPPPPLPLNQYDPNRTQQTTLPDSSSTERIKSQLKELEDTLARQTSDSYISRQNVAFNPNATLLPNLPTYPSVQNDFRDYNRFSSTSFRVKKQLKAKCSWKLTAFILMLVCVALTAVVAYFIAMKIYDLNWRLKQHPNGDLNSTASGQYPNGAKPTQSVIAQYSLGTPVQQTIPPHDYWRTQFYMPEEQTVRYNFTAPDLAVLGVYGRRNVQPSPVQYDFFHMVDGSHGGDQIMRYKRAAENNKYSSVFIHHMDEGVWYVFIYNDNDKPQTVGFVGEKHTEALTNCPKDCLGRGTCIEGQCHCDSGYQGWACSESVCPEVCQGNGDYVRGECRCYRGWKGKECDTPEHECEDPTCSGNGLCLDGRCVCALGYKGHDCSQVDCLEPDCSGNGYCIEGECICKPGFVGSDCSLAARSENASVCVRDCSAHGVFDYQSQACVCQKSWMGPDCEQEMCQLECIHGTCENQRCECKAGWMGAQCDHVECDKRCQEHGHCDNGTCVCRQGWNGNHCSLDGCPNGCNNHGLCQLFMDGWRCNCREGWKGPACNVAMEMECDNNMDGDGDGLVDCEDPDCCISIVCKDSIHCVTSPDPMEILLRKQPPSSTASFYHRMRFLVEDESVQSYATLTSFNRSQVSVIRGKVISTDNSPLIGVRVDVVTQPLYGFTLTRELGLFDILVNGGGSVTLQFKRQPFQEKHVTVMVPWNRMVTMDTVTLTLPGEVEPGPEQCTDISHDHYLMKPVVLSTWQHTQLGACPSRSTIIPESQVLQESLQIPGTDVYLVYHSSETPGYMSTIMIQLTPGTIPDNLAEVHLRVSVEGLTFRKLFEADPGLKYKFAWDRRNAYNQKVYGIVSASVGVGYKYMGCENIFWEMQSATMSGYDITSSEIGGWNLHIHHTYNYQEGILHKGDGTNIYLKERPRKVVTVMGDGRKRKSACRSCDGKAMDSRLLAPVALASGRDGSLYVGDYNHIRKLGANREDVTSILDMDLSETSYKYFMTVSPLDARLYIADYMRRKILRVKTMGAVRDLRDNFEIIAGTGEQCTPGDSERCGDSGPAVNAKLYRPKGIAINKDGVVYFVDGVNIRVIHNNGTITTLIGSQGQPTYWKPLPCNTVVSTDQAKLQWPTALAINPLDDTLHILDDSMVLKVTDDNKVLMVAGRPLHCPPKNLSRSSLLTEEQAGPRLATDVLLSSPQHIAFAPDGDLYIVESDGKLINQIRVVKTDGTISHYAGDKSRCDCSKEECDCFSPDELLATKMLLSDPTAITVTPDNVLHIADQGHLRVHSIVATLPNPDRYGQYEVLYPQTQEMYVFNRYGQHVATKNIITEQYIYNFTYNVKSYYGKLVKVTDSGQNQLEITRDYATQAKEIIPPGGQKCKFTMDNMLRLHIFIAADNSTTKFAYLSNTDLLETKETSEGHTFVYEYDENGRLASVIQPTGERTEVNTDVDPSGALVHLNTEGKDLVAMATNGNTLSIPHGEATMKVSYLHDGSLVAEYPFNMAITLETSPHPLLSTEQPLQVKRKIILPDNMIHRLEWRYYLRRERSDEDRKLIRQIGRRMRVGNTGGNSNVHAGSRAAQPHEDSSSLHAPSSSGYQGKMLMVNGDNLLTLEYDRETNTETAINKNKADIFIIQYNHAGQITRVIPDSPVMGINASYDNQGHMTSWYRGDMSIINQYDEHTGHLMEKKLSNRAMYRYLYKTGNKPSDVILPSGKQYVFHYDDYGNLKSAIMPSLAKHQFHSLTTVGQFRRMYAPPEAHGKYIEDYDSSGHLTQVLYPSEHRRVAYYYTSYGQKSQILYDWSDVQYSYYPHSQMLHSIQLYNPIPFKYNCTLTYESGDALVRSQSVDFRGEGLNFMPAKFHYQHDANFRVAVFEAVLGTKHFRPYNITYDADTGRLLKNKDFVFEYPRLHHDVVRDSNMELTREYDSYGRFSDAFYRFNNYVGCSMEVKYDSLNRVHQWRRKVGSSDLKSYEYVYDIDGNVIEVLVNGQSTWRYEVDPNSNIIRITHHQQTRIVEVNVRNQVEMSDDKSYIFDKDGFLVQRDNEVFEYNSLGLLVRAFEMGKYDIYYFYDPLGNLVSRKDAMGGYTTQFFYGDIDNQKHITHIYDHTSKEYTSLYYDNHGNLFAMQRDGNMYYIVCDPMGSPILILNSIGSVVKQISYDPLGQVIQDSAPDFRFPLSYRSGIVDYITDLIFLGNQVYDPTIGRRTSPDYKNLMQKIGNIIDQPEGLNLYRHGLVNSYRLEDSLMTDFASWFDAMGYNLRSLVPDVSFSGKLKSSLEEKTEQRLVPITSAFECAFQRDMENFVELSTVPRSKVTSKRDKQDGRMIKAFSPFQYIFGSGVMLSVRESKVMVNVLDSANEELAELATVLLNNSWAVDLSYTIHGRDLHYFVKRTLNEAVDDVKALALRAEETIHGVNVTVHRHHETPEIMRYVDIRLHGNHTVLNLRYGSSVEEERQRILNHAKERAIDNAWEIERELVQSNKQTVNQWSRSQKEELLSQGRVSGFQGHYIRDVLLYTQLADDPKNIKFVPVHR